MGQREEGKLSLDNSSIEQNNAFGNTIED
jgi:hypothetical protein